jgi:hypothetical protein
MSLTTTMRTSLGVAGVLLALTAGAVAQPGSWDGAYVANDNSRLLVKHRPGQSWIMATLNGKTVRAARHSKGLFVYSRGRCIVRFVPYVESGRRKVAVEQRGRCVGDNASLANIEALFVQQQ